ncbi:MAG: NifB/NifX family molybdenum-iron cluster-binding protein [Candidatus Aminicenantes bacterium]|nr:NifB/NifX family molybdenum-iron cluster-binding protein [Candidatus Aminicenantes bacterium]
MKIAVTASSPSLDGPVDPRFGRGPYFLIVDSETLAFEAVENPYVGASGGAGIQAAQLVAEKGVQAVLTGSCGPNAFQTLKAAGIKVMIGVSGTVREAVRAFAGGAAFTEATGPNVPSHFGMGRGAAAGGRGRGMGGPAASGPIPAPSPVSGGDELESLKQQSLDLRRHLDRIAERIAELEKKKT